MLQNVEGLSVNFANNHHPTEFHLPITSGNFPGLDNIAPIVAGFGLDHIIHEAKDCGVETNFAINRGAGRSPYFTGENLNLSNLTHGLGYPCEHIDLDLLLSLQGTQEKIISFLQETVVGEDMWGGSLNRPFEKFGILIIRFLEAELNGSWLPLGIPP